MKTVSQFLIVSRKAFYLAVDFLRLRLPSQHSLIERRSCCIYFKSKILKCFRRWEAFLFSPPFPLLLHLLSENMHTNFHLFLNLHRHVDPLIAVIKMFRYVDQPNPDHPPPTQGWVVPGRYVGWQARCQVGEKWEECQKIFPNLQCLPYGIFRIDGFSSIFRSKSFWRGSIHPDLPPPSYNESAFGPTNVKEKVFNSPQNISHFHRIFLPGWQWAHNRELGIPSKVSKICDQILIGQGSMIPLPKYVTKYNLYKVSKMHLSLSFSHLRVWRTDFTQGFLT